jgi:hypothetical protein
MLEQWNIGFKTRLPRKPVCLASLASGQGNKSNLEMIPFGLLSQHSIIPLFHHSIIMAQKAANER